MAGRDEAYQKPLDWAPAQTGSNRDTCVFLIAVSGHEGDYVAQVVGS